METVVAEALESQSGKFRPLVYWYLSMRCNLACTHCWVNSSPDVDTSRDLTAEEVISLVGRLHEIDPRMVILTGGEPLLRRDTLDLVDAIVGRRINLSIETNGILVRDPHIRAFRKALDQGVYVWISVSLDGGTAEAHESLRGKGTFEKTVRGLRLLREADIPTGMQCVVNKKNLYSVPQLFEVAANLGFGLKNNLVSLVVVNPVGRGSEHADELALTFDEYELAFEYVAQALRWFRGAVLIKVPPAAIPVRYLRVFMADAKVKFLTSCAFPLLGILPDGTLSICALTGRDGSLVLGHVRRDSLHEVIAQRVEPLRAAYETATLEGVCADCVFKHSCKGSCRAFAYSESGSFLGPHPTCDALARQGRFPGIYRLSFHEKVRREGVAATREVSIP